MKFTVPSLRKGDLVAAVIHETISSQVAIVAFNGDLIRVANESRRPLKKGQIIRLKVETIEPLSFKLIDNSERIFSKSI